MSAIGPPYDEADMDEDPQNESQHEIVGDPYVSDVDEESMNEEEDEEIPVGQRQSMRNFSPEEVQQIRANEIRAAEITSRINQLDEIIGKSGWFKTVPQKEAQKEVEKLRQELQELQELTSRRLGGSKKNKRKYNKKTRKIKNIKKTRKIKKIKKSRKTRKIRK
jgi:hypothetical protein